MPALVLLLLAAAPPEKLAALGFSRANVDEGVADVAADHFARQLGLQGFSVTTGKDLAAVIGVERQKQLLGCADADSSCLAELSNALGVDAVVTGSLGRFGSRYTVNVKATAAKDGSSLGVFSAEVGSEDELPATLSRAAREIAVQLRPSASLPRSHKLGMGIGYGAAGALIAGAVLCFGLAEAGRAQVAASPPAIDAVTAFATVRNAELQQTLGFVLLGTGIAAALVTGVVFMAFGERVALAAGPAGVSAWGQW